jgi:hypothetical protein
MVVDLYARKFIRQVYVVPVGVCVSREPVNLGIEVPDPICNTVHIIINLAQRLNRFLSYMIRVDV